MDFPPIRGQASESSAPAITTPQPTVSIHDQRYLAIEIGGTKLQVVAGTGNGDILTRRRFDVDRAAGGEGIRAQVSSALPELIAKWRPLAVGCGYGGPVDWKTGRINRSHHVPGWKEFPLGDWLRERSGLPAFVDNDANVAALGEATHGAGRDANPVFYFNSGTGVGGGLVIDGRIYHGSPPGEVEFGHLRLDRDGTIVEDRCSGREVDRLLRETAVRVPGAFLARLLAKAPPGGEAKHLATALAQSCPLADQFAYRLADDFAFALGHVIQLFHPAALIFGGGLSLVGEPLRARIAERLPSYVMDAFQPPPPLLLAQLGEDTVPVGALALAASGLRTATAKA